MWFLTEGSIEVNHRMEAVIRAPISNNDAIILRLNRIIHDGQSNEAAVMV